jgi:hypothetical protein
VDLLGQLIEHLRNRFCKRSKSRAGHLESLELDSSQLNCGGIAAALAEYRDPRGLTVLQTTC